MSGGFSRLQVIALERELSMQQEKDILEVFLMEDGKQRPAMWWLQLFLERTGTLGASSLGFPLKTAVSRNFA